MDRSIRLLLGLLFMLAWSLPGHTAEPLEVSVVERKPFVVKSGDELTGFSIELWSAVASRLERDFKLTAHESFAGMLDAVKAGKADLAVANISITAARETEMDFAQPIFDAGLQILVRSTQLTHADSCAGCSGRGVRHRQPDVVFRTEQVTVFSTQLPGWHVAVILVGNARTDQRWI